MRAALTLITSLAATSAAGDFSLAFPLDCTLGDTCFIQQFVDQDPSPAARDFTCGSLTYDGHKGTDIALVDLADQAKGVNVLAAASGKVVGTRDEMPDILQITPDAPDVSDRECGNGVVLQHEDGFETQYCHMARGSIGVQEGKMVQAGDVLGLVGLSGQTQFPHLHITVRKDGQTRDPFDTNGTLACPDIDQPTLWETPLPAPAGGIVTTGTAEGVPTFDAIKAGTADIDVTANGAALVGWVHLFGTQAGDSLTTKIIGPSGEVFTHTETLDRTQARAFRAGGRKTPRGGWPIGLYQLEFVLKRGDKIIDTAAQAFEIN